MRLYDCPNCGQLSATEEDGPDLIVRCPRICDDCRGNIYGRDEHHETVRLFEPAPPVPPGQLEL